MSAPAATLGVAHPPVDAAVVHGRGEAALDAYRNATALDRLLELAQLPAALRGRDDADVELLEQTHAIVSWLLRAPTLVVRELLEDPALRVLAADVGTALADGDNAAKPSPSAAELARLLPLTLLGHLADIDADRHRWIGALPATGRAYPIASPVRLLADPDALEGRSVQRVAIASGPEHVVIDSAAGGTRLTRGDDGVLGVVEAGEVRTEKRVFTVAGIEVVDVAAYPELRRYDVDDETVLPPTRSDLDHRVSTAFAFLLATWPEAVADVLAGCRALVALEAPDGHIYSASSPHTPGVVQLTFHSEEGPAMLAETLVHECAHVKLDGLWHIEPLLIDDGEPRFHHPWRPDPRPLRGVLLGAHAFLNVAILYRNADEHDPTPVFAREYETRLAEVREALGTLARHAAFTELGATVFAALCEAAGIDS